MFSDSKTVSLLVMIIGSRSLGRTSLSRYATEDVLLHLVN